MPVFSPEFLEEIKSRLSLTERVGKSVKLTRKGHDYWGCCPFHHEKTPSFTVSDDRGAYHCFGCGAHGDIFTFVQETEKLGFVETVERLAAAAGIALPEDTPRERARQREKSSLYDILEQACSFFTQTLFSPVGQQGLLYLQKRGLSEEIIRKFRLGYAPAGNLLKDWFSKKNVPFPVLKAAGVLGYAEQRNDYFDYFRERVIFPITDKKNRVVAFGGRVLGDGEPKYLNSAETEIFSKGSMLYAYSFAAESARKTERIIAVEGYMDAISLHAAGITQAVAPLGTALTENQIEQMWKVAGEPVLCFDNDTAGHSAAFRAAQRALPLLKPGYSLSFAFTPEGYKDPDEFVKAQGKFAFEEIIKTKSIPLCDFLWRHLLEEKPTDTPERLADFEKRLLNAAAKIQDASVQIFYKRNWRQKLWESVYGNDNSHTARGNRRYGRKPLASSSRLPYPIPNANREDARMILAYILKYPSVASEFVEDMSFVVPHEKKYADIFNFLLTLLS